MNRPLAVLRTCLVIAMFVALPLRGMSDPTASPRQVVDEFHAALIDVMKRAVELGYEGRRQELTPVVTGTFDIAFMAEKSVGRYWKKASEEERARFLEAFSRYTVANYAGRFTGYSGQHFETLGEQPARMDTIIVLSQLVDPTGDDVQLNYRLREVDGAWRIVDVYLNGTVSELAMRRSEYSSLVKREGFDALIIALSEKVEDLQEGSEES